jgi:hypothetical protein
MKNIGMLLICKGAKASPDLFADAAPAGPGFILAMRTCV